MKDRKISSIEGVRGIACFMVILSHLSLIFLPYLHGESPRLALGWFDKLIYSVPAGFLYSGTSAVYIFFVLSGYVLTYACINNGDVLRNCCNMAARRYIRLCIPTLSSVIICYFAFSLFEDSTGNLPWISSYGKNVDVTLSGAISNGLFGSIFLGDNRYNWVTWTMKIEFYGSLLVFASIPLIINLKNKVIVPAVIGIFFCLCSPGKDGYGYASFYFGISMYFSRGISYRALAIAIFIFGCYLAGYHYRQPSYSFITSYMTFDMPGGRILHYYFFNMISGVLIVYSTLKSDCLSFITSNKLSIWLGKLSFSAYLLQMPVYYVVTSKVYMICTHYGLAYVYSAIISSLLTIFTIYSVSIVFFKLIDFNSIKISKFALSMVENNKMANDSQKANP
ncbi:acyltransferase family protein [Cronobacter sakazakii]|uniref:acyltransferase family protein n=1 Tax=Cronobacter sakazakii TaxID=28141 RepID=UPI001587FCD9|nr:acyltransferase [Cronobacter sakazakii]NUW63335.1 acyltransferase [Cronobacter sakazakii]